ncbi:MAG: Gfo/Idh/MocA family oxidoreductase [Treponema sp.]|nr:Gfo/Idh/MocA family oxidoreductase [Treponema sp.]
MNIGIIGLGEVAQLMHLPVINDMSEQYKIWGICDVSSSLIDFIKKTWRIPRGFSDPGDLIRDPEIEAVLILSPDQYHGEYIERALKAGKHVFVEKPAVLASGELEKLILLEKEYQNRIVMVGYMRRYADHFLMAKELLRKEPGETAYLRFRDLICEGPFYIGQTRPVFYPKDIPPSVIEEGKKRRREHLDWAVGAAASEEQRRAYQMLTGLGCHSFSAVRELFGPPQKILSVSTAREGGYLVIVMEYDGFLAVYELVNDQEFVQFDAAIEIFQHTRKLLIKYETPYVRHQPMSLEVSIAPRPGAASGAETRIYGPSYRDPFRAELDEFYRCIVEGRRPKTNLTDALEDLKFFEDVVRRIGAS